MDHALKNLQNLCSLKTAATFFLTVDCASNLMSDTKYPKETNSILSSFVQKLQLKQGEECQFDCVPWFKVSIPRTLVQIDQLNLPNLETKDLKIEFLNFDNGILAKFFFEKFENWNFNSEHSNLPSGAGSPRTMLILSSDQTKTVIAFLALCIYCKFADS